LVKTVDLSLPHDQEPDPSFWDKLVLKITSLHSSNPDNDDSQNDDEAVSISVPSDAALKQLGVHDDDYERQEKSNYFKRMSARCKEKFEEDNRHSAGSGALTPSTSSTSVDQENSDQNEHEHHRHSLRHLLPSRWTHRHREKQGSISPRVDPKEMKAAHAAIYHQSQESNDEDEREGHRLFGAWWGCHDNRSVSSLDRDIEDDWEKINLPSHKDEKRRSMGEQNGALPIILLPETSTTGSKRKWWKHGSHSSESSLLTTAAAETPASRKQDQKAKLKKHQAIAQAGKHLLLFVWYVSAVPFLNLYTNHDSSL
jgi:hypothetical protein